MSLVTCQRIWLNNFYPSLILMNSYKSVLSNFQMTKLGSRANTVSERIKVLKHLKILEQSQTNKMKFEGKNVKLYIPVQLASFYMYKT